MLNREAMKDSKKPLDLFEDVPTRFHAYELDTRTGGNIRAWNLRPDEGGVRLLQLPFDVEPPP